MDNVGKWIVKNVIIWLGVFIYSILMDLLIRNQQNTLQAVKDGIEYQKKLIEGKYNFVADNFRDSYNQLDKRHIHQIWLIRIVSGLVAFSLLITTSMLLWYSVPEIINGSLLYLKDRIL